MGYVKVQLQNLKLKMQILLWKSHPYIEVELKFSLFDRWLLREVLKAAVYACRKAYRLGKFLQDYNELRKSKSTGWLAILELVAYGGEGVYFFIEQLVWWVRARSLCVCKSSSCAASQSASVVSCSFCTYQAHTFMKKQEDNACRTIHVDGLYVSGWYWIPIMYMTCPGALYDIHERQCAVNNAHTFASLGNWPCLWCVGCPWPSNNPLCIWMMFLG